MEDEREVLCDPYTEATASAKTQTKSLMCHSRYRRIHHVKFLAFHGNQLEYNGSHGANERINAGRIQPQGHEIHGGLVHNLCADTIIYKAAYSSCKTMFLSRL